MTRLPQNNATLPSSLFAPYEYFCSTVGSSPTKDISNSFPMLRVPLELFLNAQIVGRKSAALIKAPHSMPNIYLMLLLIPSFKNCLMSDFLSAALSRNSNKNQKPENIKSIPAVYQLNTTAMQAINGKGHALLPLTILETCRRISGKI